jgi:hypothetical protein
LPDCPAGGTLVNLLERLRQIYWRGPAPGRGASGARRSRDQHDLDQEHQGGAAQSKSPHRLDLASPNGPWPSTHRRASRSLTGSGRRIDSSATVVAPIGPDGKGDQCNGPPGHDEPAERTPAVAGRRARGSGICMRHVSFPIGAGRGSPEARACRAPSWQPRRPQARTRTPRPPLRRRWARADDASPGEATETP